MAVVENRIVKQVYMSLIPGVSVLMVQEGGAEVARPGPWWRLSLACLHSYLVQAQMVRISEPLQVGVVSDLLRPPPEGLMRCPECTAYDNAVELARSNGGC